MAFDSRTFAPLWSVALDGSPNHVSRSPDGKRIYVPLYTRHWMVVLNAEDGSIEQWWPATIGNHATEISADGTRLYVGNMVTDAIYVYDTATGKVVMAMDVGRIGAADRARRTSRTPLLPALAPARIRGAAPRATARSCGASSCRRSTKPVGRVRRQPDGAPCQPRRRGRVALHLQPRPRDDPRRPPPRRGRDGRELRGDLFAAGLHAEGHGAGRRQPELGRLRPRGQVRLRHRTPRTTRYR